MWADEQQRDTSQALAYSHTQVSETHCSILAVINTLQQAIALTSTRPEQHYEHTVAHHPVQGVQRAHHAYGGSVLVCFQTITQHKRTLLRLTLEVRYEKEAPDDFSYNP